MTSGQAEASNGRATVDAVARQLGELGKELSGVVQALESQDMAATLARLRYEAAYSRAFLAADGAMDVRKHAATVATLDDREAAEVLESGVRSMQRRLKEIGTRIDIGYLWAGVRGSTAATWPPESLYPPLTRPAYKT